MLNEIIIEGYIVGEPWKYDKQTLFRLACVRDPMRAAKGTDLRDDSDYLTVRLPAERFGGMPFTPDRTKLIRVHGFLQSREYRETLHSFLQRAQGLTAQVSITEETARLVAHNRVTTEVVAERVLHIDRPAANAKAPPSASGRKARSVAPAGEGLPAVRTPAADTLDAAL